MLWAAIPAFLRTRFNANEILTSLMLVYIAQLIVSWLVHGPWKDPDGFNFPQTKMFQAHALLPILKEGTRLNAAILIGRSRPWCVGWVFMNRSFLGYQMKVAGQAENASRYAGFSAKRTVWIGMLAGGCMAGIAGLSEVAGPIGQITEHISPGYGFAAMIVAFLGRLNPVGHLLLEPAHGAPVPGRRAGPAVPEPAVLHLQGLPGHCCCSSCSARTCSSTSGPASAERSK